MSNNFIVEAYYLNSNNNPEHLKYKKRKLEGIARSHHAIKIENNQKAFYCSFAKRKDAFKCAEEINSIELTGKVRIKFRI